VRALALRRGGSELVSAGGDGRLVAWEVGGGDGVGRALASMKVRPWFGWLCCVVLCCVVLCCVVLCCVVLCCVVLCVH